MGNDILSSDMLVGNLIHTMYNGFTFKDYVEGCWAMYDLNEFLKSFGGYEKDGEGKASAKMALDDMPVPEPDPRTAQERRDPMVYYMNYRRLYAGRLMKCIGIYQRTMIEEVKHKGY